MTIDKTILLVASFAPSLINFRGPLIQELVARGYRVAVCAPNVGRDVKSAIESLGAEVFETPLARTGLNPIADIKYMRVLGGLMKKISPDFVLTYTIKPNIWGAFAAALNGVDCAAMVTGLGYAFTDTSTLKKRIIGRFASTLYRMSTRNNKRVIFQNPDDRDDFIAAGCLADTGKARLVTGSGVDTSYYGQSKLPEEPIFLMIARLLGNKGVREYCQAAIFVKKQIPDARFLLAGYMDEGPDGIAQSELDQWINQGVEYLGALEDVRPAISGAGVYVLPSYREGTPRSVLEAMSMGRPILTSDAPGCRETTVPGHNGYLVPVRDVDALAEKMIWMVEHPEERRRMGQASRNMVVEKYDVDQVNRTLLEHLNIL